ncbi:hypothetical protein EDC01DRAFT_599301, partial [Geopyxis carbonaria]
EEQIRRAMQGLQDSSFRSAQEAATAFNVPSSTLAHCIAGRKTRCQAHEDEQLFTSAEERAIVRWILY